MIFLHFLKALDALFVVVTVLIFALVVFFYVFGMLFDFAGLFVVGSGASTDVVGIPVDAVG